MGADTTVVGVTEDMGFGHPMTRRAGAIRAQRVPSLFISSAAKRIIAEHPGDDALAAKMRGYIDLDMKMLVEDLKAKPDALIVGPLNSQFHKDVWDDPAVIAARAGYRLLAVNDRADFPAELWVRSDIMGLRASLSDPPKP